MEEDIVNSLRSIHSIIGELSLWIIGLGLGVVDRHNSTRHIHVNNPRECERERERERVRVRVRERELTIIINCSHINII